MRSLAMTSICIESHCVFCGALGHQGHSFPQDAIGLLREVINEARGVVCCSTPRRARLQGPNRFHPAGSQSVSPLLVLLNGPQGPGRAGEAPGFGCENLHWAWPLPSGVSPGARSPAFLAEGPAHRLAPRGRHLCSLRARGAHSRSRVPVPPTALVPRPPGRDCPGKAPSWGQEHLPAQGSAAPTASRSVRSPLCLPSPPLPFPCSAEALS